MGAARLAATTVLTALLVACATAPRPPVDPGPGGTGSWRSAPRLRLPDRALPPGVTFIRSYGEPDPSALRIPDVRGAVTGVDPDLNLVLISLGSDDGLRPGFVLTVHSGPEFVGMLEIEKVGADWASGWMDPDRTRRLPSPGCRVRTRL
jgi:hypothetical protein